MAAAERSPDPIVTMLEALLRAAEEGEEIGIRCRCCGSVDMAVVSTSDTHEGVRRIRECLSCKARGCTLCTWRRRTIEVDDGATKKREIRGTFPPRREKPIVP